MINSNCLRLTALVVSLFLFSVSNVRAQGQPTTEQTNDLTEEIVVTAQRRTQTLLEVPMSVTAITGVELDEKGITDFLDYAISVPSLSFGFNGAEARGSRNTIAIRGVSGTNTTGYYVDDTPIPYGVDPHLFDVERVEILRGPQGTLYGAGSMGGTVKIITTEPDPSQFTSSLRAGLSYTKEGDLNSEISAAANLPVLQDRIGARVSAYYETRSGIYDRVFGESLPYYPDAPTANLAGVDENVDGSETYGGRVALNFNLMPNLEIIPSVYWQSTKEAGAPQTDTDPGEFEQFRVYNIQEPYEDRHMLANLTIRYDFGAADLTSSTSSFNRTWKETEDITEVIDTFFRGAYANPDAPPFPLPIFNSRDQDRIVQEVRLSGTQGSLHWLLGGYYQWVDTDRIASLIPEGMAADPNYFDFGVDDIFFVSQDSFRTTEKAVFADLTWQLTQELEISGGLRYFDNETESARNSGGLFDAGVLFSGRTSAETDMTPRFAIRYALSDQSSIYSTASKGFRLGGTNTTLPSTCDAELAARGIQSPESFGSDNLWNYEIGSKGRLLSDALSVNFALFLIDWNDIQQNSRLPSCGFSFTDNVGAAEIKGFEVEATYTPSEALKLGLTVSQNDSQVTDAGEGTAAEDGDQLLNTPEWKLTASAEYDFRIGGRDGFFQIDYQYFDNSWSTFNQNDPEILVESEPYLPRDEFQIVNARMGVFIEDVQLILFVNNLFDEHANLGDARSIGLEFPGRPRLLTNRPRTVGLSARINFE